jgi:hypothetical protein
MHVTGGAPVEAQLATQKSLPKVIITSFEFSNFLLIAAREHEQSISKKERKINGRQNAQY